MKFSEYSRKINCKPICKTEQSEIFLTEKKTICKNYFNLNDKNNELYFYKLFNEKNLLETPKVYQVGDDFIEIEFLRKKEPFDLTRTVKEISKLYKKTWNTKLPIKNLDLSKEKLFYRLNYLKDEVKKREVNPNILEKSKRFIENTYSQSMERCIVHGDLKSVHVFSTEEGSIKFIDFALSGIANPWYDLSFFYMEEQEDKRKVFDKIIDLSFVNFEESLKLKKEKIYDYLRSSIFYRTLYFFGFALRHRPQKSLDRTIKELNEIIDMEI